MTAPLIFSQPRVEFREHAHIRPSLDSRCECLEQFQNSPYTSNVRRNRIFPELPEQFRPIVLI